MFPRGIKSDRREPIYISPTYYLPLPLDNSYFILIPYLLAFLSLSEAHSVPSRSCRFDEHDEEFVVCLTYVP